MEGVGRGDLSGRDSATRGPRGPLNLTRRHQREETTTNATAIKVVGPTIFKVRVHVRAAEAQAIFEHVREFYRLDGNPSEPPHRKIVERDEDGGRRYRIDHDSIWTVELEAQEAGPGDIGYAAIHFPDVRAGDERRAAKIVARFLAKAGIGIDEPVSA